MLLKWRGAGMEGKGLEVFEVGPCEDAYHMGFLTGQRFSNKIRSRLATDLILQDQLLPFARSPQSQPLIKALSDTNRNKFPRYWAELVGTAEGSGVPLLHVIFIILLNFRKEILPFVPKTSTKPSEDTIDDCSDIMVVSDSMAFAAHNEDANVALVGHTYLIKGTLHTGLSFTAYTYAGELPSCAFGFNSHGLAFTLNSVPPTEDEIVAGGIGRNFISRDLLEARSIDDALARIRSSEVSVGHSYNLIDVKTRRILNVETATRNRVSIHEVGAVPFFHANMYLHLHVEQAGNNLSSFFLDVKAQDENSISRQKRAALLPKKSKHDFLSLVGDMEDARYPIYMTGPLLYTLCTAVINLDEQTLSIVEGNPKEGETSHVFSMT
ncbi:hypothetical protein RJ640_018996 [Escallonia rubra]|uniref:Peptidase C45 hydrolase domain-containing protein n=1 Tax=Escallonia rubra TaxID=112253 RepID=A0AA88U950_9ASTE|nr:hypothetical protein RJ640_018996 [Escallonia rubra]